MLLDEWQAVPEVLNAVKRAVDQGAEPGSLLLTGSVRASLTSASWAGTGRVIQVDLHPMTVLEQRARAQPRGEFVERLFAGEATDLPLPPARAYHLRQHDGRRKVDIVLEAADGRIVGLEIKATAAPT